MTGVAEHVITPLDASTWRDFEKLADDHHGVWAGCWCLGFHEEGLPTFTHPSSDGR